MADKPPSFSLIISAATPEQMAHPNFAACLANWQQLSRKVCVVIPQGAVAPGFHKVRWIAAKEPSLTLKEVATLAVTLADGMGGSTVICDPFVVMRWDIFKIFEMAQKRQMGTSWLATSLALKIASVDNPASEGLEPSGLRWFATWTNVITYLAKSVAPNVPFASPVWGGTIASWAYLHIHGHKYFSASSLDAVALLDGPMPVAPDSGFGMITTNEPLRDPFAPK